MYQLIQAEIAKQINVYKSDENRIISDYEKEQETFKEYNGRQVLELLQNTDDEKSNEVLIKINTKNQILEISNKGENCKPFSIEGIKSLMLANFSPKKKDKNRKNYIGNKGLGFRSIINWSEEINIYSNNLEIEFSYDISKEIYKKETERDVKKIAFLALPKVEELKNNDWTTKIVIKYKKRYLIDILKQLKSIEDEWLLFVNHIEKLTIDIDGNQKIIERIKEDNQIYLNDTIWSVFEYKDDNLLPKEYWENQETAEYFDLKIAIKESFNMDKKYLLYSFFPTEVNIDFPFIVHGTFELDSSRNNINNSKKNEYILDKLVDFIADTAKELTKEKVDYRALEFLTHNSGNTRLEKLGFYEKIDRKIDELEIFPCLDNRYRKKNEVLFISNEFSEFIENYNFQDIFPNMLISSKNSFVNLNNYDLSNEINLDLLNEISKKIKDLDVRVEFIYLLNKYFSSKNYLFEILIDENGKLIEKNEEVYTPTTKTKDFNFDIPDFVKIKFINNELYYKLLDKFDINSNEKARDLQRTLKNITNIHSYEPAQVLQKIVTTTNKLINSNDNFEALIKEMVKALYKNYKNLEEKTKIPEQTKIQLLDKNKKLQNAKDLFLSSSYPIGKLTEFLFKDIFEDSQFLINKDFFEFSDDEMEEVEKFFIWLGVNKYTKFEIIENKTFNTNDKYHNFLFEKEKIKKPHNYSQISYKMNKIAHLDKIKNISIEKFILWILKDVDIQTELSKIYEVKYIKAGGYKEHYLTSNAPSYILYQFHSINIFKDYLITNEKLSKLVNEIDIDFENEIFKKYDIKRADIESLLLKLGAVEKFEDMSIERIRKILKELEIKSPDGKHTQTIYKAVRNHKEKLNDITIRLCARKNNKLSYYNQDEVYYASSVKLPKKILSQIAVINIPPRLGNVVEFFGIKDIKNIKITIKEYQINQNLTKEFQNFFYQIQPYVLVKRFDNLNKEEKQKTLNILKKSNIIICDKVTYELDGKTDELDNNDYIKNKNEYYIKINNNEFDKIRKHLDFRESFADIIGSIFNITNIQGYDRLISDDIEETKELIKREYGYESLQEAREYLKIADEFSTFWRVVYKLKNKTFNEKYKLKDIDKIKEELNIIMDISQLNYQNLSSDISYKILQNLFKELDIDIESFNNETPYLQIDFTKFHQKNLEKYFHDNFKTFKKVLYQWCLDNDKKQKFIDLKGKYENADKEVKNILFMDYQKIVENFIKDNFVFSLKDKKSNIEFDKIFRKNELKLDIDELSNLDNKDKSLLYFEGGYEQIKEKLQQINKNKQVIKNYSIDETIPKYNNNAKIENGNQIMESTKKIYGVYNIQREKQQKQKGNKAEQCVYNYLISQYGKENVEWKSKEDDNAHYDIRYKKENNWIYVEVKTFSNSKFFMSKYEKEFADEKKDDYEIFLIEISLNDKCENGNIKAVIKYCDLQKLNFIPKEYEIYYFIKG